MTPAIMVLVIVAATLRKSAEPLLRYVEERVFPKHVIRRGRIIDRYGVVNTGVFPVILR